MKLASGALNASGFTKFGRQSPEDDEEHKEDDEEAKEGKVKRKTSLSKKKTGTTVVADAKHMVSAAAPSAMQVAETVATKATVVAKDAAHKATDVHGDIKEKVLTVYDDQKDKASSVAKNWRILLERWVKRQLIQRVGKLVDKIPSIVKTQVADPDMPKFIARLQDNVIDTAWPDVRVEIMHNVTQIVAAKSLTDDDLGPPACCLLAFCRYHIFAYNRGFWGNLRDPFWILWNLIAMVPVLGVSQLLFFIIFLITDRSEEFQLLSFILSFKGAQFVSQGIIRTISGYIAFMGCVGNDTHSCADSGPWSVSEVWLVVGTFLLTLILVWSAFLLLPYSKQKGRLKTEYDKGNSKANTRAGGYLFNLLLYDVVCFVVSCVGMTLNIALGLSTTLENGKVDWNARRALFNWQLIYGYLSFPFFIFKIPVLAAVLTHSTPTAYDRLGRCRPLERPKPKTPTQPVTSDDDSESETRANYWHLDPKEAEKLLAKAKDLMLGKSLKDVDPDGEEAPHSASTWPAARETTVADRA